MNEKLLVVFGATGNQGGSVVQNVLASALPFRIRAVTRDPSSPAAQKLATQGVEVVKGDFGDVASLNTALEGANAVFLMTNFADGDNEAARGIAVADAAVKAGVEHVIFSTLPSASEQSNGKYQVPTLEQKKACERHIRSLPVKSCFISPGCFMTNFFERMKPRKSEDGSHYFFARVNSPQFKIAYIDIEQDFGKYVVRALQNPDHYDGRILYGASDILTLEQTAQLLTRVTGKKVVYKQVPEEVFERLVPNGHNLNQMFKFLEEYNWGWGADVEKAIAESNEGLQGLNTLDNFFKKHPLELD